MISGGKFDPKQRTSGIRDLLGRAKSTSAEVDFRCGSDLYIVHRRTLSVGLYRPLFEVHRAEYFSKTCARAYGKANCFGQGDLMSELKIFVVAIMAFFHTGILSGGLPDGRYLYVASPGIRNYLEYGGHGLLVFDIDNGHKFVKRIPIGGVDERGRPINVKGICASAITDRVYISTLRSMMCLDLVTEKLLWEKKYEGGCDRMSVTPDGKVIYLPSLEKGHWHVVDAAGGDVITRIEPNSGSHNTICGISGRYAYLAGLKSPTLTIAETSGNTVAGSGPKTDAASRRRSEFRDDEASRIGFRTLSKTCGPFSHNIRPFTVNGSETVVYVCINDCLGFEIGDLTTGKKLHRVEVAGFEKGKVKRHGCPSHGIGMTPDESQIWVTDGANSHMHIFDATVMPPKQIASLPVRDQPGWVTFTINGDFAYPSSGDVFNTATRELVTQLTDEEGRAVGSEKMLEIDWRNGEPIRTGDQFGLGRRTGKPLVQRSVEQEPVTFSDAASGKATIVDLTWSLDENNAYWPGEGYKPFQLNTIATLEKDGVLSKAFSMPEHMGTHIDAPNHFEPNQPDVAHIDPDLLIGPGVVVDIEQRAEQDADTMLTVDDLRDWEAEHGDIPKGAIVLLHTGWGRHWKNYARYKNQDATGGLHFPGFSGEAATWLIQERSIRGIGIDTLSIDRGQSKDFEVHHIINGNGRYGLENVAFSEKLPARGFHLIVAPIKIEKGSGGPARIFAVVPQK